MRKIVISIVLAFSFTTVSAAVFRPDSLYSKWIIDSRMGDFRNKNQTNRFLTPASVRNVGWDYVPGLVAKAIIKAWEQYKDMPWSNYYFTGIQDYADNVAMVLGASNIDDLNAGKIYFELYRGAMEKGQTIKANTYKTNVTTCRNTLKNNHNRISGNLPGKGGFWHKLQYTNQMWLDGLYMGPALFAEWQGNFGHENGDAENTASWNDIALQFDTIFKYTWDAQKKLNYHAWSAEPKNTASSFWADPVTGRSQEFWGRGVGWFFAALVDVLEYMPATHPARVRLVNYVNLVADGLKSRQDAVTGCWYQLLQYNATKKGSPCNLYNYPESSASSMFAYSYYKGIRLGILDKSVYKPVADKAYMGLIANFVVEEGNGKIKLIQSCESAGLSGTRKGDASYYLCGSDVGINNDSEGKVLGPFIMASLEYEKAQQLSTVGTTLQKDDFRIYTTPNQINLISKQDLVDSVQVFNQSGQLIAECQKQPDCTARMTVPHAGIYFVRLNHQQMIKCNVD
jgi:unsaturated rhamnogalacturonyl hydrolase